MKTELRDLTISGLFVALIAVGAFIKVDIPLPLYTMHFTFQWFFVVIASILLGAKKAALCVASYLCIGLIGIPVFAAGGGPAYVLRPGFGFLLGFFFAAYVMGILSEKIRSTKYVIVFCISAVGMLIYYVFGAIYFYMIKNLYMGEGVMWSVIVVQYCLITVIPDLILCALASKLSMVLKPLLDKTIYA